MTELDFLNSLVEGMSSRRGPAGNKLSMEVIKKDYDAMIWALKQIADRIEQLTNDEEQ